MSEARYPADIMATAVVPWTADWQLDERLFRRELAMLLAAGYRHIYIFGTAGEGYAVTDQQFLQITRVYVEALRGSGVAPMVGVISLSLPTIIARIEAARELCVRHFQISLPSWGALTESEIFTFFEQVLGRFSDCQFLHYNLLRTKRLVTPEEYGRLAAAHPNLVATKNSTDAMTRVRGLLTQAPQLRHFLGEAGYAYGSQIGDCGLLISVASVNAQTARAFFAAGQARDAATVLRLGGELQEIGAALIQAAGVGEFIDGAYDKILWKLHDPEFPLRLLPPYRAAQADAAEQLAAFLREHFPHWAPSPVHGTSRQEAND
ncbi:MAG: dihydrodipicolinate synthase family protein [Thermomicrobiales bacterium]